MMKLEFWAEMSSLIDRYDLLQHPYYQAWREGKLTLGDLREYACEYYHHVASFPLYLREFAGRLPDGELRQRVLNNLWDELGIHNTESVAHNLIWLRFAVGTGALPKDVFNRKPIPVIAALIEIYLKIARSGVPAQALAAFYIYESQVPRIAHEKAASLRKIYGLDEHTCSYFNLHATADIAHSRVWHEQLTKVISSDPKCAQISLAAAERAARALWQALDGIDARRKRRSEHN